MKTTKKYIAKLKNKYGTYYYNGVFELGKEMLVPKSKAFIYDNKEDARDIVNKLNVTCFTTASYKWTVETIDTYDISGKDARQIIYDYLLKQPDNKKWLGWKIDLKRGQYDIFHQIYLTEKKDINNIRLDGCGGNNVVGTVGSFYIDCSDKDCILIAEHLKLI